VVVGRYFEVFVKRVEALTGRVKWGDGLENEERGLPNSSPATPRTTAILKRLQ